MVVEKPFRDAYAHLRADPNRPLGRRQGKPSDRFKFFVGVDLGQVSDYTALAVIEKVAAEIKSQPISDDGDDTPTEADDPRPVYHVRMLDRAPLGTPYPRIVQKVGELVNTPPLVGNCHLLVDETGAA